MQNHELYRPWMSITLKLAGIYNLLWGLSVILFPGMFFNLFNMPQPHYPQIWQCLGMAIGLYGIAYLIAAKHPLKWWPITLIGLLGKIFGPLGFLYAILTTDFPPSFGIIILTNDLIWWIPFSIIVWRGLAYEMDQISPPVDSIPLDQAMQTILTQNQKSLSELSKDQYLMVIFMRHAGCIFCREMLQDIKNKRSQIEANNVIPVLVHMMPDDDAAQAFFAEYNLEDLPRISDPERKLYQAFDLSRGTFSQLLGPAVWWRGFKAFIAGNPVGKLKGDGMQMPGAFIIKDSQIVIANRFKTAGDRVDFEQMSCDIKLT